MEVSHPARAGSVSGGESKARWDCCCMHIIKQAMTQLDIMSRNLNIMCCEGGAVLSDSLV